jgi:RNA polymerase sigma-70 factor, ECF subfamily
VTIPFPGASGGREPRARGSLSIEAERDIKSRLIARDESALVELIDVASPWLLGLAQSLLSEQHESEEVVMDAFRIAWEKIGSIGANDDGRLIPWLLHITRNRALDRLRSRRRTRARLELVRRDTDPLTASVPVEPDESALPGWHVHRSVHAGLDALSPDQRAAVNLAYFHGLTHSEIAEHLGIPLGTVKTRLRAAFDRLRLSLAPLKDWIA